MVNNTLNAIFGTIGILWIINLVIRIRVATIINRVIKNSELSTDTEDSPCEYPLDEKLKYVRSELQIMTDLDNKKTAAHYIDTDNAGSLANHIEEWAQSILDEIK